MGMCSITPTFGAGVPLASAKFLIEHGVFNPVFRFGCEDIELGYRLSKQQFKGGLQCASGEHDGPRHFF